MNLKEAVLAGLRNSLDIKGCDTRGQFWWFALIYWPIASFIPLGTVKIAQNLVPESASGFMFIVFLLFASTIVVYIPLITAIVRRLHDVGKSGYLGLLWFVPVANLYLIYLLAKKGNSGNRA